jgi:hypothetical protein
MPKQKQKAKSHSKSHQVGPFPVEIVLKTPALLASYLSQPRAFLILLKETLPFYTGPKHSIFPTLEATIKTLTFLIEGCKKTSKHK